MATSTVPITAGSGTPIAVESDAGFASGGARQLFGLVNPDATRSPNDPDGTFNVSVEATTLLVDDFSGTLTANWTTGGTAPASSGGQVTFTTSTSASALSYMRSIGTFPLRQASYIRPVFQVKYEAAAVTNATRWWGIGLNQSTPTAAAPVLNGAVFELSYSDGALYAVTYSAGTRTQVAALTRVTDNAFHRYEVWLKQSTIYWTIDSVPVATAKLPQLAQMANLALIGGVANHTTAPSTAPQLIFSSAGVADHSGTNRTISDGVNPWIQATVKPASTAAAATDLPLVTAFHPSSSFPSGTNLVGAVAIGATTRSTFFQVTTATAFGFAVKTAAGSLHELTVSNTTTTAAFVKIYNSTSVTVGSGTPVATYRLAATGSVGDTLTIGYPVNGKYFTSGIYIVVTGAVGASDATATVAGITLSGTYV